MRARSSAALLLMLAFQGHAAAPADPQQLASQYRKLAYDDLCIRVGRALRNGEQKTGSPQYNALLTVAKEQPYNITPENHADIKARQITVAMSWCAVFASIGRPTRSNRTVNAGGEHYQLVYDNPRRYVYLQQYRVIGWQD